MTPDSLERLPKETVKAMARQYVENPRTIILAVLPNNVDIATQEIQMMLLRRPMQAITELLGS
jgi:hypothetical protein